MDIQPYQARALRELLASEKMVVAPGIYDHMSLLLAERAGFSAVYASGYWGSASALGEPDVGIAGASDFVRIFGSMANKSSVPVIADADTGFGSLTNLDRAVRSYGRAGIAAMQIEDQTFPKVCGHVGRAASVPASQMAQRVRVAVEARGDGDLLIIARTDARRSEGLEAAIERLHLYSEAGADLVFLEAPESEEEIAQAAAELDKPLMLNAAHGGVTPVLNPSAYAQLGVKLVIYPAGAPLSAAQAAQDFYRKLAADDANIEGDGLFDFQEMSRLLGMDDVIAFQDRHKAP
jgi:2-methylisocitrate lyase-like PEP mutase family enzyme